MEPRRDIFQAIADPTRRAILSRLSEGERSVKELAERMTQDYIGNLRTLNVTGIDHMPRATEHI